MCDIKIPFQHKTGKYGKIIEQEMKIKYLRRDNYRHVKEEVQVSRTNNTAEFLNDTMKEQASRATLYT